MNAGTAVEVSTLAMVTVWPPAALLVVGPIVTVVAAGKAGDVDNWRTYWQTNVYAVSLATDAAWNVSAVFAGAEL
jgi:hypothetical protein